MHETSRGLLELTEILVAGLDFPAQRNLLTAKCAELFDVRAAALLGLDADGAWVVEAASEETAELLTRIELAYEQGPGVDAFRTGECVECTDLGGATLRWPRFAPLAVEAGVAAAFGLPCRLRDEVVGAMTLYMNVPGPLPTRSEELRRGLVNAVTLGVTAYRGREMAVRAGQLQNALDSRVTIEQAKGMLAERQQVTVDEAFAALRGYARKNGVKMREVARDVVKGVLKLPSKG
ncbi:GAF and ANTAR domain-containing protein [Actinophytocola glycyrrhizae]|uniref:GAF and ANTAR domain-containing protein n=1 Tax=Actinophytocola glycyrrhizae TaxID=2044873 RepID=A0ABV9S2U4_9PSEU